MKKYLLYGLIGLLISACDSDKSHTTTTESPNVAQVSNSREKEPLPIWKVAMVKDLVPFNFENSHGELAGLDIDLIRQIGKKQGYEVQIFQDPADQIVKGLLTGEYDLIISGVSYSEERAKYFGFSDSYLTDPSILAYLKPDLNIQRLEDIANLKVAVLSRQSRQMVDAAAIVGEENVLIEESLFNLYKGLIQGKFDVMLVARTLFTEIAHRYPEYPIQHYQYQAENDPSAQLVIFTQKNNQALIEQLNQSLAELKQTGELEQIKEKYLKKTH